MMQLLPVLLLPMLLLLALPAACARAAAASPQTAFTPATTSQGALSPAAPSQATSAPAVSARGAHSPAVSAATTSGSPGNSAASPDDIISQQLQKLNLNDLQTYINQVDRDLHAQSDFSLGRVLDSIRSGKLQLNLPSLLQALARIFFREILAHAAFLGQLLVLGTVLALLEHLTGAFEGNTIAKLAHGVGMLGLFTIALSSFTLAMNTGRDAINTMTGFMQALLPVMLTLMAAMGSIGTVSMIQPVVVIAMNLLGALTGNVVFPLVFCAAILGVVNLLSDRIQVSRLAGFFRDASGILISLFLTIFLGVMMVQGAAGSIGDSVGIRTAKFATAVFVPVIGKILTDAVDVVMGCSLFLKSAIGILGAVTLLVLCALPVIKILSAVIVYRLAAALMQPLGAHQLGEALHLLGNYLFIVFAAVLAVGLMFMVAVTILVSLGNTAAMPG
jgi:stage III sporulation protein AE